MIRNVVFDFGNVFVRWSPGEVIERCFGLTAGTQENHDRAVAVFRTPIWLALNRGEVTVAEAQQVYRTEHGLSEAEAQALFQHIFDHEVPIEGTEDIARRLKAAGLRLFGLTDNVRELVEHLRQQYPFYGLLEGVVVSADVGVLKPDPRIFHHLLTSYALDPAETVFLDDMPANVEGARRAGMQALQFATAPDCERDLRALGLSF